MSEQYTNEEILEIFKGWSKSEQREFLRLLEEEIRIRKATADEPIIVEQQPVR